MENKIVEFVREFNAGLEDSNEYNMLQYQNDGFQEGIVLPEIYLWSDDEGSDYFRTKAISSLVRQLNKIQEVAGEILADEIEKFFAQKKTEIKEKFPEAKLKYSRTAICRYKAVLSGQYNEDVMEQFAETLEEDFKWLFSEFKLDVEY